MKEFLIRMASVWLSLVVLVVVCGIPLLIGWVLMEAGAPKEVAFAVAVVCVTVSVSALMAIIDADD